MSSSPPTLEWLLDPMSVDVFAAEVWQRQPRRLAADRPGYFDDLFGFAALEQVLEYGQPKAPTLRLASSQRDPVEVPLGRGGRLDIDRIRSLFADGYSIVVNNVQDFAPGVAQLVQAMMERMSYPVEANCYCSPPNAQGFKPHYDTHDVIVAQVTGEKLWRVYGEDSACPLQELTNGDPFRRENLPEPDRIRLRPGDVLYIPRGWIHEAETDGLGSSLHLTFGVHAPTARDLLLATIEALCRVHPQFRQPLPLGYLRREGRTRLEPVLQELLQLVSADLSVDAAVTTLEDDFIRRGQSASVGELVATVDALSTVGPHTAVERKRHLHARLIGTGDEIALQFGQSMIQAPESYRPAMTFILSSETPFSASDLPGLEDQKALDLVQALLCDGLVRLSQAPGKAASLSRAS